jgi:hypothetical protein
VESNNFGGTKLKRNYIWEYGNKKGSVPLVQDTGWAPKASMDVMEKEKLIPVDLT